MNIKIVSGIVTTILPFIAYAPYLRATWRGKIKPHPFSWIIWGSAAATIGAVLLTAGGGWATWTQFSAALLCFAVAALAVKRKSRFAMKITRTDWTCLTLAAAALVLFVFAKNPLAAIILLVATDNLALIPTLIKVRAMPFSETQFMWWIQTVNAALVIVAIAHYNATTLTQGVSNLVVNLTGLMFIVICQYNFTHRQKSAKSASNILR